jgi:naphtho-gamma-pyrone polyketide synthase
VQSARPLLSAGESAQSCHVFLFGDLASAAYEQELRTLIHDKGNETLRAFFDQVGFSLREEIGKLSTHVQGLFPRFTTLVDLVAKLGETSGTPVLRFTLLCVCEIGQFIR